MCGGGVGVGVGVCRESWLLWFYIKIFVFNLKHFKCYCTQGTVKTWHPTSFFLITEYTSGFFKQSFSTHLRRRSAAQGYGSSKFYICYTRYQKAACAMLIMVLSMPELMWGLPPIQETTKKFLMFLPSCWIYPLVNIKSLLMFFITCLKWELKMRA